MLAHGGVTVVIPFYNDIETIGRALDSIQRQSLAPERVVIVNDGSTARQAEALADLIKRYEHSSVQLLTFEENLGPSAARNAGWNDAQTEYVAFLDADDTWHPSKLRVQIAHLSTHRDIGFVGTSRRLYSSELQMELDGAFDIIRPIDQLLRNRFVTSSIVVRTEIDQRFDEAMRFSEDNYLWCKLVLSKVAGANNRASLTYFHSPVELHRGASSNLGRMFMGQLRAYTSLYREGLMPKTLLGLCYASASLRFLRRRALALLKRYPSITRRTRATSEARSTKRRD